jgi:hypothetical protein
VKTIAGFVSSGVIAARSDDNFWLGVASGGWDWGAPNPASAMNILVGHEFLISTDL